MKNKSVPGDVVVVMDPSDTYGLTSGDLGVVCQNSLIDARRVYVYFGSDGKLAEVRWLDFSKLKTIDHIDYDDGTPWDPAAEHRRCLEDERIKNEDCARKNALYINAANQDTTRNTLLLLGYSIVEKRDDAVIFEYTSSLSHTYKLPRLTLRGKKLEIDGYQFPLRELLSYLTAYIHDVLLARALRAFDEEDFSRIDYTFRRFFPMMPLF